MPIGLNFDLGNGGLGVIATIGGIILIDIVLSGDNALVIGAAASRLPRAQRWIALIWGGIGAIVLRVVLAALATFLLLVPLLQALGGVVLMGIAVRLLIPDNDEMRISAKDRLFPAMLTIIAADVTMSLDNIIAIGALAKGDVALLGIGLLVSMAVLFLASALIARIIERLSILLDLAALVLAFTAANLIAADPFAKPYVAKIGVAGLSGDDVLHIALVALMVLADVVLRTWRAWRSRRATKRQPVPAASAAMNGHAGVAGTPSDVAPGTNGKAPDGGLNVGANGTTAPSGDFSRGREPVTSRPLGAQGESADPIDTTR